MKHSNDQGHLLEKFKQLFILGAPRSGTSLLHALICTSNEVNDYINECTFLTALVRLFKQGYADLEDHNRSYFDGDQKYIDYQVTIIRNFVVDSWLAFDTPRVLALKDPLLTLHADALALFLPKSEFVVAVRNPEAVMSSYLNVDRKAGKTITLDLVRKRCDEITSSHSATYDLARKYGARVKFYQYENFFRPDATAVLSSFLGISNISEDRLWISRHFDINKKDSIWLTEKYGKGISSENRGENNSRLSEEQRAIVQELVDPIYNRIISEFILSVE